MASTTDHILEGVVEVAGVVVLFVDVVVDVVGVCASRDALGRSERYNCRETDTSIFNRRVSVPFGTTGFVAPLILRVPLAATEKDNASNNGSIASRPVGAKIKSLPKLLVIAGMEPTNPMRLKALMSVAW